MLRGRGFLANGSVTKLVATGPNEPSIICLGIVAGIGLGIGIGIGIGSRNGGQSRQFWLDSFSIDDP